MIVIPPRVVGHGQTQTQCKRLIVLLVLLATALLCYGAIDMQQITQLHVPYIEQMMQTESSSHRVPTVSGSEAKLAAGSNTSIVLAPVAKVSVPIEGLFARSRFDADAT